VKYFFMYSKTADRTIDLFETFAKAQTPMSLSELARSLNVPPSSCFNLIRALEERGYLYFLRHRGQLYPTRRLYQTAKAIVTGDSLTVRLEPMLQTLRNQTKETIILGKRQGNRVIYLNVIEGPQTIRYIAQVGDLKPLHSSSIGKSILGALDPEELEELLRRLPLNRITDATITERGALLAAIKRGKRLGYFVTAGENVADGLEASLTVSL
jgi:DNA-binding IclR family transcriptional regulator